MHRSLGAHCPVGAQYRIPGKMYETHTNTPAPRLPGVSRNRAGPIQSREAVAGWIRAPLIRVRQRIECCSSWRRPSITSSLLDCRYNPRIRTAAANIPIHEADDLLLAGTRVICQQCNRRQDHAGSAITALECFQCEKSFLHRVKLPALLEPFDSGDLFILR